MGEREGLSNEYVISNTFASFETARIERRLATAALGSTGDTSHADLAAFGTNSIFKQSLHGVLALFSYSKRPTGQLLHSPIPFISAYFPDSQSKQNGCPTFSAARPGRQSIHIFASSVLPRYFPG